LSYERGAARRTPTWMIITLANALIFVCLFGAAGLGLAAVVYKRRHRDEIAHRAPHPAL
jgi:hypothetical protein